MANRPKGKLFVLLAIFIAIGLVTASGAFQSVAAQRTVSVATAGDANALVQFNDLSGGEYVTGGATDEITLDFTNVNLNASTDFGAVFNISLSDGTTGFTFYVAESDDNIDVSNAPSPTLGDSPLDFRNASDGSIEGSSNAQSVGAGGSADIHVFVNTTNQGTININNETIVLVVKTN